MPERQQSDDAAAAEHADAPREQSPAESVVQQLQQLVFQQLVIEQLVVPVPVPIPVIRQFITEQLVVEQFLCQRRLTEPRGVRAGFAGQSALGVAEPARRTPGRQHGADRLARR